MDIFILEIAFVYLVFWVPRSNWSNKHEKIPNMGELDLALRYLCQSCQINHLSLSKLFNILRPKQIFFNEKVWL